MALRFVIGNVEDFILAGIVVSNCRKSIDNTQALIHIETLNDEQLELIRYNESFEFTSKTEEILEEEGWKQVDNIGGEI